MIVVDASAAVKWFFVEERSVQARAILRAVLVGSENVVAPPLLVSEVVNAIRRRMFREALPLSEARQFVSAFLDVPKTLWSPDRLYIRALEVAEEYNLPAAYDAQYVAAAELLECTLWTADERLLRALGGRLSNVCPVAEYAAS